MDRFRIVGALAVALIGLAGISQSYGAPIQRQMTYSTSGTVGTSGVDGTGSVSFEGVTDGTLTTGTPFNFGRFVPSPAQDGSVTTFMYTPYDIYVTLRDSSPDGGKATIHYRGDINGSTSESRLYGFGVNMAMPVAFPEDGPPFPRNFDLFSIGNYTGYLQVDFGGNFARDQPMMANLRLAQTVPEPSLLAVFGCAAAFFVIQRRHRAARA